MLIIITFVIPKSICFTRTHWKFLVRGLCMVLGLDCGEGGTFALIERSRMIFSGKESPLKKLMVSFSLQPKVLLVSLLLPFTRRLGTKFKTDSLLSNCLLTMVKYFSTKKRINSWYSSWLESHHSLCPHTTPENVLHCTTVLYCTHIEPAGWSSAGPGCRWPQGRAASCPWWPAIPASRSLSEEQTVNY